MSDGQEKTVLVERQGAVGIVRLNRPSALNALNAKLIGELDEFDDEELSALIRRAQWKPHFYPYRAGRLPG